MRIVSDNRPEYVVKQAIGSRRAFVVTDTNVERDVLARAPYFAELPRITIPAGEEYKTLETVQTVWQAMAQIGLTRHDVVVNIGGGVVTDLGGFAASCFKRGVSFINVPTTLLAAVDASVGGKTGVDFMGLKNEIGVFADVSLTVLSTCYFDTLPAKEMLSGYAEMLKHALLAGPKQTAEILADAPTDVSLQLLRDSVTVKENIVEVDPYEKGLRKALNLGHTAGHAIESLLLERKRPVPHGFAVAWGLVVALVLSHLKFKTDTSLLHQVTAFVKENYGSPAIECADYEQLLGLMHHDKKNLRSTDINFTLLKAPGEPEINCAVSDEDVKVALDIARDLLD